MCSFLFDSGLEEHSPETAEGGCRGPEGSLWEGNEQRLQDLADDLNALGHRKAANTIERFLPGLMSCTAFPKQHGKRIRTTNMMERVNRELKRRTRVVGVFPNEESLLRLVGSILMDINEEWVTGRRYLTMEKE
ncbi:MAG TPA: transposase [Fervidobacterium sp.]|nr:transposase [Fervidobacterium sp.]